MACVCLPPPLLPVLFFPSQMDIKPQCKATEHRSSCFVILFFFRSYLWVYFTRTPLDLGSQDINQLQQIMRLTGTPPASLISRMPSHEVSTDPLRTRPRLAVECRRKSSRPGRSGIWVTEFPHVTLFHFPWVVFNFPNHSQLSQLLPAFHFYT